MDYSAEVIKFPATTLSNKGLDVPELTEPYHIVYFIMAMEELHVTM